MMTNVIISIVIAMGRDLLTQYFFSVSKASVQSVVPSPIPSIHFRPIRLQGCIIDASISKTLQQNQKINFWQDEVSLTSLILLALKKLWIYSFLGSN